MKNPFKNGIVHYRLIHGANGSYDSGILIIDYKTNTVTYNNSRITQNDEFYGVMGATSKQLEDAFPCLTDNSFIEDRPPKIVGDVRILKNKGIVFSYKNSEERMTLVRTIDVGSIRRLNLLPKK
ncbi:MAG: hypothetical protein JW716_02615 [Candidatus Aenigmarchaeota archaeon]|nr:hypothetical protein [Candidatus Aenigmarchaeota archaeon]